MTLDKITATAWHPIAHRVHGDENDEWDWLLSPHERSVFYMALLAGGILSAQRREADGEMVLVARRAKVATPRLTHVKPVMRA